MAAMAPGGQGLGNYYQSLQQLGAQQSNQPYGMDYATFNPARKAMGASQNDLMAAYGYAQQPMPQMQNPFSSSSYSSVGGMPQMQTPFSYQQPAAQPQTPFSYQTATGQPNKNYGLSYSAPMQLPQYIYDTIRDVDSYQSKPVQAYQSTRPISSGPSQAIVGRSSQMRGTPNVAAAPVAKAKGGIASLLKKHK